MQYTIPETLTIPVQTWPDGTPIATTPLTPSTPFVLYPPTEPQPITGWICPVCGGGVSPYTSTCPCTNTHTVTVTYSNQQ